MNLVSQFQEKDEQQSQEQKIKFDQDEFDEMVRKGTEAWKDVGNATEWVEDIRGNQVNNLQEDSH
jgi:hypothetical protein